MARTLLGVNQMRHNGLRKNINAQRAPCLELRDDCVAVGAVRFNLKSATERPDFFGVSENGTSVANRRKNIPKYLD